MGQRNTPDALAYLRRQHDIDSRAWRALCLKLCRSARNIPAVFPSASAAMQGTPMSERVYDVSKLVEGMVVYFDDPNDSNKFGHIATLRVAKGAGSLAWSNDVRDSGGVDTVDMDWFRRNWGDKFQFAAISLNGFDLILPKPVPVPKPTKHPIEVPKKATLSNLDYAIHRMDKAIAFHRSKGHTRLVRALLKERQDIIDIKSGRFPK